MGVTIAIAAEQFKGAHSGAKTDETGRKCARFTPEGHDV